MNTDRFEQQLAEVPRAELSGEWRKEILDKACITPATPPILARVWNATPKLAALVIAAAWVAIAALQFTMPDPGQDPTSPAVVTEPPTGDPMVAWVDRQRSLLLN